MNDHLKINRLNGRVTFHWVNYPLCKINMLLAENGWFIYVYMLPPPEKSTVFMGVVRANSRKIFEVEDKFSQNNYFC